jgi:Flp pilus assembly protein TadB
MSTGEAPPIPTKLHEATRTWTRNWPTITAADHEKLTVEGKREFAAWWAEWKQAYERAESTDYPDPPPTEVRSQPTDRTDGAEGVRALALLLTVLVVIAVWFLASRATVFVLTVVAVFLLVRFLSHEFDPKRRKK